MTLNDNLEKYPEAYDGCLDCVSYAITCSFNKRGTLLAVGCNDGRIVIWDFITRCIAKIIQAHTHPVCSISWTRNGYNIASGSTDNIVCVWNVLTAECIHKFRFPTLLSKVQFNPRKSYQLLICLIKHPAVLIDLTTRKHITIPLDEEAQQDTNVIASFDRQGSHIYTGNSKGKILIFDSRIIDVDSFSLPTSSLTSTLELIACFKMTSIGGSMTGVAIKEIEFAKRGENFLVCTADRVIRIYNADIALACKANIDSFNKENIVELEPIQKLCDLVNRTQWKKCCFSGGRNSLPNLSSTTDKDSTKLTHNLSSSTYVCAGSAKQHSIYIWELATSTLVKILHGTKGEILLDLAWHPSRGIIASVSGGGAGSVTLWSHPRIENWSAFAPDFKELDDNVEYHERESEFDLSDEDQEIEEELGGYFNNTTKPLSQTNGSGISSHINKRKSQKNTKTKKLFFLQDENKSQNGKSIDENDLNVDFVDVTTIENNPMFTSSDEEEEDFKTEDYLLFLPTAPEIDDPENPIQTNFEPEPPTPTFQNQQNILLNNSVKDPFKISNEKPLNNANSVTLGVNNGMKEKELGNTLNDIYQTNASSQPPPISVIPKSVLPPPILDIQPIVQTLKKAQEVITSFKSSQGSGGYAMQKMTTNLSGSNITLPSPSRGFTNESHPSSVQISSLVLPNKMITSSSIKITEFQSAKISVPISNLTSCSQIIQSEFQKQILAKMAQSKAVDEIEQPIKYVAPAPHDEPNPTIKPVNPTTPNIQATSLILPPTLKFKTSNPVQIMTPSSFTNHTHQNLSNLLKQTPTSKS